MINNQQYIFNRQVPKKRHEYEHTMEDADDTPAYAKSTLSGVSITFPQKFHRCLVRHCQLGSR